MKNVVGTHAVLCAAQAISESKLRFWQICDAGEALRSSLNLDSEAILEQKSCISALRWSCGDYRSINNLASTCMDRLQPTEGHREATRWRYGPSVTFFVFLTMRRYPPGETL